MTLPKRIRFVCLDCGTEISIRVGAFAKRPCALDDPHVTSDCPVCGAHKMLKIMNESRSTYDAAYHAEQLHKEITAITEENEQYADEAKIYPGGKL